MLRMKSARVVSQRSVRALAAAARRHSGTTASESSQHSTSSSASSSRGSAADAAVSSALQRSLGGPFRSMIPRFAEPRGMYLDLLDISK